MTASAQTEHPNHTVAGLILAPFWLYVFWEAMINPVYSAKPEVERSD